MSLKIEALRYNNDPLYIPLSAILDENNGDTLTLGRAEDNHLVLVDEEKVVSGKHATIKYEQAGYFFIDRSTNGTEIISGDNQSQWIHLQKIQLNDQDRLRIGDYDLIITITNENIASLCRPREEATVASQFFSPEPDEDGPNGVKSAFGNGSFAGEEMKTDEYALFNDMEDDLRSASNHAGFTSQNLTTTAPKDPALPGDIGLDDFFSTDESFKPIASDTKRRVLKEQTSDTWLDSFFEALGFDIGDPTSPDEMHKTMQVLGKVLRELLQGLMRILQGRAKVKSQLGLEMTIVNAKENNPLKFAESIDQVLEMFLKDQYPGFLDALSAVRQGYEDIEHHQLATTVAVRASVLEILKRFDPQKLPQSFNRKFVIKNKSKYWSAYSQAYPNIVEDALENIFGQDFVRAYERQIAKLHIDRDNK